MNNIDFLNSELFNLPLTRDSEYFPNFVKSFFQNYLELLEKFDGSLKEELNKELSTIENLTTKLCESIDNYYVGNVYQSYKIFEEAINSIKKFLLIQKRQIHSKIPFQKSMNESFYFRARANDSQTFSKKDMIMRSFEERESIPTYRYSIPGLPCIYLSNKIYTAWSELGCPDINKLQVSRFEIDDSLLRLYFANTMETLTPIYNDNRIDKFLLDYLIYFPLQAICSIKVKNQKSIFKPEYIFPQFLMQWVKDENIDMIEYISIETNYRRNKKNHAMTGFTNYAIPAKTSNLKGICTELKKKIKLTEPISWQTLNITNPKLALKPRVVKEENINRLVNSMTFIEIISGVKVSYNDTSFGLMEDYLIDNMNADYME